jgi:hypothetical protein
MGEDTSVIEIEIEIENAQPEAGAGGVEPRM